MKLLWDSSNLRKKIITGKRKMLTCLLQEIDFSLYLSYDSVLNCKVYFNSFAKKLSYPQGFSILESNLYPSFL